MRNYYNMDAERRSGCGDLPGGVTPTKLRRSSVLLIGVLLFLVGVLLFFLIVIVLLFGLLVLLGLVVWLRRLMVQPQVEENVRDVIMHCCNTRFIKEHKPSNHIRARIKSHVYTTE